MMMEPCTQQKYFCKLEAV